VNRSLALIGLSLYIAGSCVLAYFFPQSVLAFLLVEGSLLLLYYTPVSGRVKSCFAALVLLVLLPILGYTNA